MGTSKTFFNAEPFFLCSCLCVCIYVCRYAWVCTRVCVCVCVCVEKSLRKKRVGSIKEKCESQTILRSFCSCISLSTYMNLNSLQSVFASVIRMRPDVVTRKDKCVYMVIKIITYIHALNSGSPIMCQILCLARANK